MPELAYMNGELLGIEAAVTSVDDRGYQFGDAVYEYIASYNGRLFALEPHLERLQRSLEGLAFPPLDMAEVRTAILRLYAAADLPRAGVYVQISRGVAPRNHAWSADLTPQVLMTVRQVPEIPAARRQQGAKVITTPDLRWGRCDLKTTQLLPNVMAKTQALSQGADDAVFLSAEGIVREATSSNVFMVSANTLVTHPLTPQILAGITRMVILQQARTMHLQVEERCFDEEALYAADEVFLTGTVTEVLPVVRVNDRSIGNTQPGPLASKLWQALRRAMGA